MADAIAHVDVQPADAGGGMSGAARRPLGELLVGAGFMDEIQLADALQEGDLTGLRLGEVVVRHGWATEDDVAKLLADQWGLDYVDRTSIFFDVGALKRLSREQAQRLEALPTRVQDDRVVVAVAEPTEERLAALYEVIGDDTVVVVVPKSALDAGLRSELLSGAAAKHDTPPAQLEPPPLRTTQSPPAAGPAYQDPPPEAQHEQVAAPPAPTSLRELRPPPPPAQAAQAEAPEDVAQLLGRLQQAALDAAALQLRVGELAGLLDRLAADLGGVTARLASERSEGGPARTDVLEEQLGQQTELTERLKAQLNDLARTLDTLD